MKGLGEQNGLRFNGTSMSYRIGEHNKNLFIAANVQTSGNFPGFQLNNQYRVYINYWNAINVQLNQAGGQVEMSLHASPMIQASAPQVRPLCYLLCVVGETKCVFYRMSDHVRFWIRRAGLAVVSLLYHLASACTGAKRRR
jgi:hypothetical protein